MVREPQLNPHREPKPSISNLHSSTHMLANVRSKLFFIPTHAPIRRVIPEMIVTPVRLTDYDDCGVEKIYEKYSGSTRMVALIS